MHKGKALIEIRIAGLSNGIHEYSFTCTAQEFDDPSLTAPPFSGTIAVKVVAEKTDTEVVTDIETTVAAELNCDICLDPVHRQLTGRFRIFFIFGSPDGTERECDEEYRILAPATTDIDLTEDVRETLLLSLPVKVTCDAYPECMPTAQEERDIPGEELDDDAQNSAWKESLKELKRKLD